VDATYILKALGFLYLVAVLWVVDLIQCRTSGGLALHRAVLDAFPRRLIGWATDERPVTELAVNGLTMAIRTGDLS